jgi:hypothetical protein
MPSMTGEPCVTLFNPAADVFPDRPDFSEPLGHPGLTRHLVAAAHRINYDLL